MYDDMRRLVFFLCVLAGAIVSMAQGGAIIVPRFNVGDSVAYKLVGDNNIVTGSDSLDFGTSMVMSYVVEKADEKGFVLRMRTIDASVSVDGANSAIVSRLTSNPLTMMKGFPVLLQLDANGMITGVLNMKEVRRHMETLCDSIVENFYAMMPMLETFMDKDDFRKQMMKSVSEERLLRSYKAQGIYALYGLGLEEGAADSVVVGMDINAKRTVSVFEPASQAKGAHVETRAEGSKSAEEVFRKVREMPFAKDMLARLPANLVPQVEEQLRDKFAKGGSYADYSVYDFFPNGCLSTLFSASDMSMAGTDTSSTMKVECVYHSW